MTPDVSNISYLLSLLFSLFFIYTFRRREPARLWSLFFSEVREPWSVRSWTPSRAKSLSLAANMCALGYCRLLSVAAWNLDVFAARNGPRFAMFRLEGDVYGPD